MTLEARQQKIQSYANAYTELVEALGKFPKEMWQFRYERGCWSIHEIIIHITDSEANSYIRARRLIAEPGRTLMDYDENQWAAALDYHDQDIDDTLNLFRWLRSKTYSLIKALPESTWSNTAYHPENGDMTLDDWLDTYEAHVREHVEQMQQNLEAWQAQQQ